MLANLWHSPYAGRMANVVDHGDIYDGLTPKQLATLDLISEGRTHKEIAVCLGIGKSATGARIDSLRSKFGHVTKAELGRIHREHLSSRGVENVLRETSQLPGQADETPKGDRRRNGTTMQLADSNPVF